MTNSGFYLAFGFGTQELLIVALVLLVLFGGTKIPQLMRGMGQSIREFKSASNHEMHGVTEGEASP